MGYSTTSLGKKQERYLQQKQKTKPYYNNSSHLYYLKMMSEEKKKIHIVEFRKLSLHGKMFIKFRFLRC